MPRLSIIIPLLGDQAQLDDTLVSVLENRPANCEILVVHAEPYDDPYGLAGEVRFLAAAPGATLAECLNLGLRASRAAVVHVLSCGVEVSPGWAEAAIRHFRDAEVAAVAAVVLSRRQPQRVASAGLGYRPEGIAWRLDQGAPPSGLGECWTNLCGPDVLAAFYCKSTLEAVGGFSLHATDMLMGIDAALALRRAGFRCVLEPACVARVDTAAVYQRPTLRRGCDAERLFWRWASAHGWVRSVAGHAALLAGECAIGLWRPSLLAQLAGRLWGLVRAVSSRGCPKPAGPDSAEGPAIIPLADFAADRPHRRRQSSHAA